MTIMISLLLIKPDYILKKLYAMCTVCSLGRNNTYLISLVYCFLYVWRFMLGLVSNKLKYKHAKELLYKRIFRKLHRNVV